MLTAPATTVHDALEDEVDAEPAEAIEPPIPRCSWWANPSGGEQAARSQRYSDRDGAIQQIPTCQHSSMFALFG